MVFYERGGLAPAGVVDSLTAMGYKMQERRGYSGDIAAIEVRTPVWVGWASRIPARVAGSGWLLAVTWPERPGPP